jgi:hypothetical protein
VRAGEINMKAVINDTRCWLAEILMEMAFHLLPDRSAEKRAFSIGLLHYGQAVFGVDGSVKERIWERQAK